MNRQFLKYPDPALDALLHAPADRPAALLHAGRPHPRWGFPRTLAAPDARFAFHADGRSSLTDPRGQPLDFPLTGKLWADLRTLLNTPDFPGPWIGYLSYDLARLIEPRKLAAISARSASAERTHDPRIAPPPWPLVELLHCPHTTTFPPSPQVQSAAADEPAGSPVVHSTTASPSPALTEFQPDFTRPQYEAAVGRVLDYIAAGDVFQVNLAQRFRTDYAGDPRELFARLAAISPAWYGAYLELGPWHADTHTPQRALLSTSPELFLHLQHGHVVTRPIKGTRPNLHPGASRFSGTPPQDPLYTELLHSEKDTAELNMIVDLMRNDLGRVCRYGSVRVTQPRSIESHPTVHHGVATVEGDLHESRDVVDLLRATLPGGSVTGAPKVRAMQIIDELEPVPRGPYCGAIGLLTKDTAHLNIAIRTILLESTAGVHHSDSLNPPAPPSPGVQSAAADEPRGFPTWHASFSVGGGIVADSTPAAEYDETLTKAAAMAAALSGGIP